MHLLGAVQGTDDGLQMQHVGLGSLVGAPFGEGGVGADRGGTSGTQSVEHGAFGQCRQMGRPIVDGLQGLGQWSMQGVCIATLHGQRSLGGGRHENVCAQTLGDESRVAEPFQSGAGQDDGVQILPAASLGVPSQALDPSQPGVDIASDVDDLQIRAFRQQLGESAWGSSAHLRPLRQIVQGE